MLPVGPDSRGPNGVVSALAVGFARPVDLRWGNRAMGAAIKRSLSAALGHGLVPCCGSSVKRRRFSLLKTKPADGHSNDLTSTGHKRVNVCASGTHSPERDLIDMSTCSPAVSNPGRP